MKENLIGQIINKTDNPNTIIGEENNFLLKESIYEVLLPSGETVKIHSDLHTLIKGDKAFIQKTVIDDSTYYAMGEYVRYNSLIITGIIFLFIVFFLFGKKAIRSILSLILSFSVICFILIPLTLKGYNPILISSLISIALLSVVMYVTHGFNRVTTSALLGSYLSIFFTIIFSYIIINFSKITGRMDETSLYLAINTNNTINLTLLVISSIIIGVIGVVDDAAITQASVVKELKSANDKLSLKEYYNRAMKVGSSHAGAMINTLILAYISSSLPLLLLFYTGDTPFHIVLNKEIVATEIMRSLIGSSGLLLAIPLTTLIAVYFVNKNTDCQKHYCGHNH